jgi:hypothetical protein
VGGRVHPDGSILQRQRIKVEIAYDFKDLIKSTQDFTGQFPEINSKPAAAAEKIDKTQEPQQDNSQPRQRQR